METRNNNQVPQENAVHLVQNKLNELMLIIELLQADLDALKSKLSENPNSCDKYTHLLPTGYEFCTEEEAEKWVKVENHMYGSYCVGDILLGKPVGELKDCSRPIRPIQYHVAVHDVVTAEPNPYAVDWSNAPEWADVHCYCQNRYGYWMGAKLYSNAFGCEWKNSDFTLPTGLDWKQSKTTRP